MSLVSEVYFLSALPPLNNSTVSRVTVSSKGSPPPRRPLLNVRWSVFRTMTTRDSGWLNSCPCIVGGIIAKGCDSGPPTRGDLQKEKKIFHVPLDFNDCTKSHQIYWLLFESRILDPALWRSGWANFLSFHKKLKTVCILEIPCMQT